MMRYRTMDGGCWEGVETRVGSYAMRLEVASVLLHHFEKFPQFLLLIQSYGDKPLNHSIPVYFAKLIETSRHDDGDDDDGCARDSHGHEYRPLLRVSLGMPWRCLKCISLSLHHNKNNGTYIQP